jgi:hypothetical protein
MERTNLIVLLNVWTAIIHILAHNFQTEFKQAFYLRMLYMKPCRTNYNTPNHTLILNRNFTTTHVD